MIAPLQKRAWRLSKMKGFVKSCIWLKPQTHAVCICVETRKFRNKKLKNKMRKTKMFKTQCKMQKLPKHMIICSQDEWHQGYNHKHLNLRANRFVRGLLQVKTENINFA